MHSALDTLKIVGAHNRKQLIIRYPNDDGDIDEQLI